MYFSINYPVLVSHLLRLNTKLLQVILILDNLEKGILNSAVFSLNRHIMDDSQVDQMLDYVNQKGIFKKTNKVNFTSSN